MIATYPLYLTTFTVNSEIEVKFYKTQRFTFFAEAVQTRLTHSAPPALIVKAGYLLVDLILR
jgi:hypothetical protein